MRRLIRLLAPLLSLVIALFFGAIWIGSYTHTRYFVYIQTPQVRADGSVEARAAEVYFTLGHVNARISRFSAAKVAALKGPLEIHPRSQWRFGTERRYGPYVAHPESQYTTSWWNRLGFRYYQSNVGYWTSALARHVAFTLPLWAIVLFALAVPIGSVVTVVKQRRRARIGLCPRCGYDLRGTPDRCPECGHLASRGQSAGYPRPRRPAC